MEVLKMIFVFVSWPPLPRGVPEEGPDCHFPMEIVGFWADSGPNPLIFNFYFGLKHS
jgi:hypothetical protein